MKETGLTIILMVVINTSLITIIPVTAQLINLQGTSLGEVNKSSMSEDSLSNN